MVENPYPYFRPDVDVDTGFIRPGSPYEKPKLSPEQERFNALSFPAYQYVLMGREIELTKDKRMQLALKADRLRTWETVLTHSQRNEVIEFGAWWTEQIKRQNGNPGI